MERAIAYIRVSDQRQVDDGSSLITQEKQVLAHAATYGYQLLRIFTEEGESAKTDQRPKLQELISFCKAPKHQVHVLIVPKIDRLARNVYDYSHLKTTLRRYGVRLESIGERIDDTPVGRFTESIMASVAQLDNEVRAERCKGGMVEAVSQGRWVWKAPLGYRNVRVNGKGTIEPDPKTAPIISEVFHRLAENRHSITMVQTWLKSINIQLSSAGLYSLVRNRIYIGKIDAFGRSFAAVAPFAPLISEESYYKAQTVFETRKRSRGYNKKHSDFLLRRTARCECGKFYTACWSQGRRQRFRYYRCMHCKRVNYRAETMHDAFVDYLNGFVPAQGRWEQIRQRLAQVESSRIGEATQKRSQVATDVEELRKLQAAVVLKNASGIIPDEIAKQTIAELDGKIADAFSQTPSVPLRRNFSGVVEFAEYFLNSMGSVWRQIGFEMQKELLRFMFPNGVCYNPNDGFRTPGNSFLERLRVMLQTPSLSLVEPDHQFTEELLDWIVRLYEFQGGLEIGQGQGSEVVAHDERQSSLEALRRDTYGQ